MSYIKLYCESDLRDYVEVSDEYIEVSRKLRDLHEHDACDTDEFKAVSKIWDTLTTELTLHNFNVHNFDTSYATQFAVWDYLDYGNDCVVE